MKVLQPTDAGTHGVDHFPLLDKDDADDIIGLSKQISPSDGRVTVEGEDALTTNKNIRDVTVYPIGHAFHKCPAWDALLDAFQQANDETFRYNLTGVLELPQLLHYETPSSGYGWHVDIGAGKAAHRKLSISILLSPPSDYEGGEICFFQRGEKVVKPELGDVVCFSSFIPHRVKPITKGERWSLVAWASGPRFM